MGSSSGFREDRRAEQQSHHRTQDIRHTGPSTGDQRLLGASWRQLLKRLYLQMRTGAAHSYQVVPIQAEESGRQFVLVMWRIELHGLRSGGPALGLDIGGDAILGRSPGDSGSAPDINFEPYGASAQGVSRHHVLLRPSKNHLYLIDLASKNGTWINGVKLGEGHAHPLQNLDTVTLGKFTFQVKIIDAPTMGRTAQARAHLLGHWSAPGSDSSS